MPEPPNSQPPFTTEEADIVGKLRERTGAWRAALSDEKNAILPWVLLLTDGFATHAALSHQNTYARLPDFIARQLESGFTWQHFSLIRGLTESRKDGMCGVRGVNSLCALLQDVEENCQLLTRRAMFAVLWPELGYDEAAAEQATKAWFSGHGGSGWLPKSCDSDYIRENHQLIDALAETPAAPRRNSHDHVSAALLKHARESVQYTSATVNGIVNKHIAHAATEASIRSAKLSMEGVPLSVLRDSNRAICGAADLLCQIVLGCNHDLIVTSLYDEFAGLENLIGEEDTKAYIEKIKEVRQEIRSWTFRQYLSPAP